MNHIDFEKELELRIKTLDPRNEVPENHKTTYRLAARWAREWCDKYILLSEMESKRLRQWVEDLNQKNNNLLAERLDTHQRLLKENLELREEIQRLKGGR